MVNIIVWTGSFASPSACCYLSQSRSCKIAWRKYSIERSESEFYLNVVESLIYSGGRWSRWSLWWWRCSSSRQTPRFPFAAWSTVNVTVLGGVAPAASSKGRTYSDDGGLRFFFFFSRLKPTMNQFIIFNLLARISESRPQPTPFAAAAASAAAARRPPAPKQESEEEEEDDGIYFSIWAYFKRSISFYSVHFNLFLQNRTLEPAPVKRGAPSAAGNLALLT